MKAGAGALTAQDEADALSVTIMVGGTAKTLRPNGSAVTALTTLAPGVHAWLDCEVVARHPGGTHTIYVGRVSALATGGGRPLVFHIGRYTRLAGG